MTWPFENDTSAIVKKLAKRNVSSNRIFCFFNVLTIALAISLIVGISLFQQGSKISEQKILNQMQQATIGGLTAEQIEVLKKEPDLEDIVPYKHSDSFLMDGIKFEAVYMPTGFGIIKSYELVSGTCPEQYNEIVIDKNVQLELGYQLNIGDTITLPTAGSKTEDFIITGFTDNVETGTFYFYVSPAYAEQGVLLSDIPYSALIRVNGATEMGLIDFENGEYYITINHNTLVNPKPYGISEYQVDTPFSQELMEELQQIPEVKEIYATERTAAIIEYHDEQLEIPIIPITPDNQEEILKTLPVDWTYETLVKQDAMVILGTSVQKEVYHACPSIGEKVTLRWFDGAEHSIDILIAGTSEKSMNEGFYLPKETIEKLWGDMDLTASLTLSVPEYEKVGKSVESKLNNILSRHPDLVMETLQEVKASSANTIHNTSVQVYGVSAFVIMFSIFNLTNTLISRISTRRKEFGILESIGMTKKQIKKMLLHESVLLIIPCLIITVVAGTLMGYLLVRILSANGLTYFQYTFPFIPLLIYGVCLIITPIIISAICLKIQCRNSLVERIKMAD